MSDDGFPHYKRTLEEFEHYEAMKHIAAQKRAIQNLLVVVKDNAEVRFSTSVKNLIILEAERLLQKY